MTKNKKVFTPMPFYRKYHAMKYIEKYIKAKIGDCRVSDSFTEKAYSLLKLKKIFLPFVNELSISDLILLADHEIGHFNITRVPAKVGASFSVPLYKLNHCLNILDDIIINKDLPFNRLKSLFQKLGDDLMLTAWEHFTEDERKKIVSKGRKDGIFKDSFSEEEIYKRIKNIVEERKSHKSYSIREFVDYYPNTVKNFCEIFTDSDFDELGNGHAEYSNKYNLPDWDLVREISNLIRSFRTVSYNYSEEEKFYGKKINRKYILSETEIHPFIKKEERRQINKPKILAILDCSGSMEGNPEMLAKSFLVPVLSHLDTVCICKNEYFQETITNSNQIISIPMTGDDEFDNLDFSNPILKQKYAVAILITDLNIDSDEVEAVGKALKSVKAPHKYILCVQKNYWNRYKDKISGHRIIMEDKEDLRKFIKKLVNIKI